jgi:hypothetical protein
VLPDELAARADTVGLLHEIAGEVPDELWAHRALMFERHLAWPIAL